MAREATLRAVVAIEERILTKELVPLAESGKKQEGQQNPLVGNLSGCPRSISAHHFASKFNPKNGRPP